MIPAVGAAFPPSFPTTTNRRTTPAQACDASQSCAEAGSPTNPATTELNTKEKRQVDKLKARDREVRAHEAAHQAAAGGLARGGASFSYAIGPDGKRYAVGGEVSIDTSDMPDDPQATLRKADAIRAAALAPAQPSSQDLAVAAQATQMAMEARVELAKQSQDHQGTTEPGPSDGSPRGANPYQKSAANPDTGSGQLLNIYA
jgi:hypothetical protein